MQLGIDEMMETYNRWFNRGCPKQSELGYNGREIPDLHIQFPPKSEVDDKWLRSEIS
jgi:hypothetical protein